MMQTASVVTTKASRSGRDSRCCKGQNRKTNTAQLVNQNAPNSRSGLRLANNKTNATIPASTTNAMNATIAKANKEEGFRM